MAYQQGYVFGGVQQQVYSYGHGGQQHGYQQGYDSYGYGPQQRQHTSASADHQRLMQTFNIVDRDRNGQISARELNEAIQNMDSGASRLFNKETIRMMIAMFDEDNTGTVNFEQFEELWDYMSEWNSTYDDYDRDGSGYIDINELKSACMQMGFRLPDSFYSMLIRKFDNLGKGIMLFDDFIQCCIRLQSLTKTFRAYDRNRRGVIQLGYEQFIHIVMSSAV